MGTQEPFVPWTVFIILPLSITIYPKEGLCFAGSKQGLTCMAHHHEVNKQKNIEKEKKKENEENCPLFSLRITTNKQLESTCCFGIQLSRSSQAFASLPSGWLSPDGKRCHGHGTKEQRNVGTKLQPWVAAHPLAEEISSNEVHQGHVDQYTGRHGIQDALHHQRPRTVGVVERCDACPHSDPGRCCDGEENGHQECRGTLELSLNFVGQWKASHKSRARPLVFKE